MATATTLLMMAVVAMLWRRQLSADSWLGPWAQKPKPEFTTLLADNGTTSPAAHSVLGGAVSSTLVAAGQLLPQPPASSVAVGAVSEHGGNGRPAGALWGAPLRGGGSNSSHFGFGGGHAMGGGGGGGFGGATRQLTLGSNPKKGSPAAPKASTAHRTPSGGGGGASTTVPGTVIGGTETTPIATLIGPGTPPVDPGTLGTPGSGGPHGGGGGLSTTPEPASAFLLGTGLLGLAAVLRRRWSS